MQVHRFLMEPLVKGILAVLYMTVVRTTMMMICMVKRSPRMTWMRCLTGRKMKRTSSNIVRCLMFRILPWVSGLIESYRLICHKSPSKRIVHQEIDKIINREMGRKVTHKFKIQKTVLQCVGKLIMLRALFHPWTYMLEDPQIKIGNPSNINFRI